MHKQNDLYQGHTATQRLFGARTAFLKFGIGYKVSKLNMGTIEKYYFWKNWNLFVYLMFVIFQ